MTEYHFQEKPATTPSVNEAKVKRRKVLDGVLQRRKLMYTHTLRKSLAYDQSHKNSPDFD